MARFVADIEMENAAFDRPEELPSRLRIIAGRIEQGAVGGAVTDSNGNTVGIWSIEDRDA